MKSNQLKKFARLLEEYEAADEAIKQMAFYNLVTYVNKLVLKGRARR